MVNQMTGIGVKTVVVKDGENTYMNWSSSVPLRLSGFPIFAHSFTKSKNEQ